MRGDASDVSLSLTGNRHSWCLRQMYLRGTFAMSCLFSHSQVVSPSSDEKHALHRVVLSPPVAIAPLLRLANSDRAVPTASFLALCPTLLLPCGTLPLHAIKRAECCAFFTFRNPPSASHSDSASPHQRSMTIGRSNALTILIRPPFGGLSLRGPTAVMRYRNAPEETALSRRSLVQGNVALTATPKELAAVAVPQSGTASAGAGRTAFTHAAGWLDADGGADATVAKAVVAPGAASTPAPTPTHARASRPARPKPIAFGSENRGA